MISPYQPKSNLLSKNLAVFVTFLLCLQLLSFFASTQQLPTTSAIVSSKPAGEAKQKVVEAYGKLPVYFIENKGQLDERVEYYATGAGYSFYFTQDEVTFSFVRDESNKTKGLSVPKKGEDLAKPEVKDAYALKIKFLGASPNAILEGKGEQKGKVSYLAGNDPQKWQANIPTFSEVIYKNLYSGIDLIYKGNQKRIKYEFVVSPGANHKDIRLGYSGADSLTVDKQGNLLIGTPWGDLEDEKPYAYQLIDGKKVKVEAGFAVENDTVSFSIGSHNHSRPLVIDPQLEYSTCLGGNNNDYARAIAIDATGSAYVAGYTDSADFPTTPGAFDTTYNGGYDGFVTKFSPDGSALVYSSYISGSGTDEQVIAIAIDATGSAYVAGYTDSADFPTTPGAFDTTYNGSIDTFIVKLSSDGSNLVYATFLGGPGFDSFQNMAVDEGGSAYVVGGTASTNFPTTTGAFQTTFGGSSDAFVAKLSPDGSTLVYSTYLGGSTNDGAHAVAVDSAGFAYVAGGTWSSDFPTTAGAFDNTINVWDSFVTKLSPDGSTLVYSTYLGGSSVDDKARAIAIDATGSAYVAGYTDSADFPTTPGAFDTTYNGGYDGFVTKFSPDGSALVYSSYLGGTQVDYEHGFAFTVDSTGLAYIVGSTSSSDFPVTIGALDTTLGGAFDCVISTLSPNGSTLVYSTYLGGNTNDGADAVAIDSAGFAYVAGYTNSTDFPVTVDAFDTSQNGGHDSFIAKLDLALLPGANTPVGTNVQVSLDGSVTIVFGQVTAAGNTSTRQTSPPYGPPSGFRFRGNAYDITTTATYTSPITLTFSYNKSDVEGNESNLKLFHWTGSRWEDCTTSVDTVNNTITGLANSLSPFAVGEPEAAAVVGYNPYWFGATVLMLMLAGIWLLKKKAIA